MRSNTPLEPPRRPVRRHRSRNLRRNLRGAAAVPTLLALLGGLLLLAPFAGTRDRQTRGGLDWRRAANQSDLPFEEDLADCEGELGLGLAAELTRMRAEVFDLGAAALAQTGLFETRRLVPGRRVYERSCQGCHGADGDGGGPAAAQLFPRPRNFRRGQFKFTSTETRPLRSDLARTVERGLAGSAMPAFDLLASEQVLDVVEYVRWLAIRGEFETLMLDLAWQDEELPDAQEIWEIVAGRWSDRALVQVAPDVAEPAFDAASVARGDKLFHDLARTACATCHGETGLGDGPTSGAYFDAWGYAVRPRDFTSGVLRSGDDGASLWTAIATGIKGTPMGAFRGNLGGAEIWDLVHYVQALGGRAAR